MPVMTVDLKGDGLLERLKLQGRPIHHLTTPITVGALEGGMASGKPSVVFAFTLEDGSVVLAESSLTLFVATARALVARYGEP